MAFGRINKNERKKDTKKLIKEYRKKKILLSHFPLSSFTALILGSSMDNDLAFVMNG